MQNLEQFCKAEAFKNKNQILFSFKKISPQVIIKLWSFGKKFQGHLWWKRSVKTGCFIINLFMQNLWSVPTSIVTLSGGGGSQSTELEGPRSTSGTQPDHDHALGTSTVTTLHMGRCSEFELMELWYTLAWHVFTWYQEPPAHKRWPPLLPLGKHSVLA